VRLLGLAAALLSGSLSVWAPVAASAADPSKGNDVFQDRCSMCHLDEGQGQGPNLKGVVGRKAGALPGFAFTSAMTGSNLVWTPANLDRLLQGPAKLVPGTTMPMTVPSPEDRADLIAYLATLK
jgi:cytochrome c2